MSGHAEPPIYTLRTSMDASQCFKVDAGLKNFKLLSRRLHTLLNMHATELQILQRLYYKNKNQHRGSLFWRKVVEIRRYSERFEQHKPHILIDDFRRAFYGPGIHNANSLKGPWTHFPDANHISSTSNKIKNSINLLEKTCQACLNAYMSFHRSMQSAAFLPIFLMFIAISSRMRVLCLELRNILQQAVSYVVGLVPTVVHTTVPTMLGHTDVTAVPLEPNLLSISSHGEQEQRDTPSLPSLQMVQAHITVERKIPTRVRRDEHSKDSSHLPKKKKRKIARDEIDDIFDS